MTALTGPARQAATVPLARVSAQVMTGLLAGPPSPPATALPAGGRHRAGGRPLAGGRHRSHRRAAIIAAWVLACGLAVTAAGAAGLALSRGGGTPARPAVARVPAPAGPAAAIPGPAADRPVARPVALTIPAIGVRTPLIRLGLTPAGMLQVPPSPAVAGWYDRSPRPGATGSAIIAGHIDSLSGPGVFFRLSSLRPGDRVYVRRADGTLAEFRVTAVRSYLKVSFPTAAVYGPAPSPQLRLITCGGVFDQALGSYLSNVVVYATAVSGGAARPIRPVRSGRLRTSHRRRGSRALRGSWRLRAARRFRP